MAKLIEDARVEVIWEDGRRSEIGTIHIESNCSGDGYNVKMKVSRWWIGWHFVKMGLRVLFRKSQEGEDTDERTGTDPEEY